MTAGLMRLTMEDLAALMHKGAGVTADPAAMAARPDADFEEWGLDSLGLLGIVGELENRSGRPLPPTRTSASRRGSSWISSTARS